MENDLRPTGVQPTQDDTATWEPPVDNREEETLRLAEKFYRFVESKD